MNAGVVILILLLVLTVFGVGGYLFYKYSWVPGQCNGRKEDSTLNILNWIYDSDTGNCIANTCTTNAATSTPANKTDDGDKNTCPAKQERTYEEGLSGKCTGGGTATSKNRVLTDGSDSCKADCDAASECKGYDWNSDPTTTDAAAIDTTRCNLYSGKPTASDKAANVMCYPLK
jgi:hypothetical protein